MIKKVVRYLLGGAISLAAVISACSKNQDLFGRPYNKAYHDSLDKKVIDSFIRNHGLTGVQTNDSGLRYILDPNNSTLDSLGQLPNDSSSVSISYYLRLGNVNAIVDSQLTYSIAPLRSTIEGIREGLQLVHQGGRVKLIIPSSLGFRDNQVNLRYGAAVIPANSVLIYDISLLSVTSVPDTAVLKNR